MLWLGTTTGAAVAALTEGVARYGPARFWGVAVYVAVTVYLTAPLIKDLMPMLGAGRPVAPVLKESK